MLEPKSQEIALRFGLDKSEDLEGQSQGAYELSNFDFEREGAAVRRHGFTKVQGPTANTTAADYIGLAVAGPTLALVRQGGLEPMLTATLGTTKPVLSEHTSLATYWSGVRVQQVDAVKVNGYLFLAATQLTEETGTELSGTPVYEVSVKVVEMTSGAVVLDTTLGSGSYAARTVAFSDRAGIFYLDSSHRLCHVYILPAVTAVLSSVTVISGATTTIANVVPVDAVINAAGTTAFVTTVEGGFQSVYAISATGTTTATRATGNAVTGPVAITVLSSGVVAILRKGSTRMFCELLPATLASVTSSQQIDASDISYRTLSIVQGATDVLILGDQVAGTLTIYTYNLVATSSLLSTSVNTSVASKPWSFVSTSGRRNFFVVAGAANMEATEYRTNFVLSIGGSSTPVIGQLTYDEAGQATTNYLRSALLPKVIDEGSETFLVPLLATLETADANAKSVDALVRRIRVSRMTFGLNRTPITATLGGNVYMAGSLPLAFDGSTSTQASFVDAPSAPVLTTPNAGVLTGTYSYKVIYEASDAHGNLQVSPPSPAISSGAVAAKKITVTHVVGAHYYDRGISTARDLRVKIYRTAAGGAIYYLVHTYTAAFGGTVAVDDNVTDASLILAETLYTTGSVLESEPAPPVRFVCAHRNRLFGLRSDTPRTVAYTQETFEPFFPRWNSSLTFRVDNEGGDPTALGSLADTLFVFQAHQINVVFGQGPSAVAGDTNAFSQPETIVRGVGVSDAARGSLCATPDGLMFQHTSGVQLLTPDRQIVPVGLPVLDEIGTDLIFRGRYMPSRHQAWFLLQSSSGTLRSKVLVYDVRFKRWLVWTTPAAFVDVLEHAGTCYAIGRTDLYKYDTATYADASTSAVPLFPQTIGLPWFRGDRSQELRLWKVLVSGRKDGTQGAAVDVALQVYTQSSRSDKAANTADNTFTWSSAISAAVDEHWLLAARVVTQRCRAFRCRLTFTPTVLDNDSPYLTLSAITYDYGVTPTRSKTPKGRRPVIS